MSLTSESMIELMAYADGELEGEDRERVEKLLASSDEAVRFVEQVGGLGDFVKMTHATRDAKTVQDFDIADRVMVGLAKQVPASSNVIELGSRASREKRPSQARTVGFVAVVSALALAASVFFLARPKEAPLSQGPVAERTSPARTGASANDGSGVEVEKLGQSASVLYLPGQNEVSTSVVVWVDESAEK